MTLKHLCTGLGLALGVAAGSADAQILASERATVAQTIDGMRLTVEYVRPRARGRENIYGGLEPYNSAWTPGADSATTLEITRPIKLLGRTVPKGKYSIWLVLREQGAWTFVLDPHAAQFHTAHPDSTRDQIRAPITAQTVPHTEALTWTFSTVGVNTTTLEMRWGTKGISVPIEITSTYPLSVNAADVTPLVGVYDFTPGARRSNQPSVFTVSLKGDKLFGIFKEQNGQTSETQLLQSAPDEFMRTFVRDGEILSLMEGYKFHFQRAGGVVGGFELFNGTAIEGRGVRRK
ncbi:MAG: DUF2911 domain-containing protein [Gemmatimonadaceae bacterium]